MKTPLRVSALAAALGLSAWAAQPALASTADAAVTKKSAMTASAHPKPVAQPTKQVGTKKSQRLVLASSKHNGTGVVLRYGVPATVQPGQTGNVTLLLSNITAPEGAQVRVVAESPSLRVVPAGGTAMRQLEQATTLSAGEAHQMDLQVSADTDGMYFVNVFVSQQGRSSAYSIPVKVGRGTLKLKQEGTAQTTPSGEKIISLPSSN